MRFRQMLPKRTTSPDEWTPPKGLQIDWDTVYGELTFALTIVTLTMLFVVANVSSVDADELSELKRAFVAASGFHGMSIFMINSFEFFGGVSWMAVWLCGSAWGLGLIMYLAYMQARMKFPADVAAPIFLNQYRWELQAMYYMLIFSLVCSGVSSYFLYHYKMPLEKDDSCLANYNPSQAQIDAGTSLGVVYCFRNIHFFLFWTGVLWFPLTLGGVFWMRREANVFSQNVEAKLEAAGRLHAWREEDEVSSTVLSS